MPCLRATRNRDVDRCCPAPVGCRRAEAKAERVVDVRGGNQLHTLEHLNAALGLLRFGGFGTETVDITLQMR